MSCYDLSDFAWRVIDRFLSILQHFRPVVIRHEKRAEIFHAMGQLASMLLWLRRPMHGGFKVSLPSRACHSDGKTLGLRGDNNLLELMQKFENVTLIDREVWPPQTVIIGSPSLSDLRLAQ